jgi:hypothetical protein
MTRQGFEEGRVEDSLPRSGQPSPIRKVPKKKPGSLCRRNEANTSELFRTSGRSRICAAETERTVWVVLETALHDRSTLFSRQRGCVAKTVS